MNLRPLALIVFLAGALAMGQKTTAAESPPIPLAKTPPGFAEFFNGLQAALVRQDAEAIYRLVADSYTIERDHGGMFIDGAPARRNFSAWYPLDAEDDEYRAHGWKRLTHDLPAGAYFERKPDGRLCCPHGSLGAEPFALPQLCFRRIGGRWLIKGRISGGD